MTKLKLGAIEDDKPVKLTVEFPAAVHRNLVAYAEAIGREGGQAAPEPGRGSLRQWSSVSWRLTVGSGTFENLLLTGRPQSIDNASLGSKVQVIIRTFCVPLSRNADSKRLRFAKCRAAM